MVWSPGRVSLTLLLLFLVHGCAAGAGHRTGHRSGQRSGHRTGRFKVDSRSRPPRPQTQSEPGPSLERLAAEATAPPGRELLAQLVRIIDARIVAVGADPSLDSAEEVAARGSLTGCLDFAIVFAALLRMKGVSVVYIHGVRQSWAAANRRNPRPHTYEGHTFLEIELEGRWQLIDPTAGILYPDCPVAPNRTLPDGFLPHLRGRDMWERGIHSLPALHASMREFARRVNLRSIAPSDCQGIRLRRRRADPAAAGVPGAEVKGQLRDAPPPPAESPAS